MVNSSDNKEVISENVDKGLLQDGQNIMQNGLETNNVSGVIKLLNDISINTHGEIGGMIYKNKNGDSFLRGLPYSHSTITKDDKRGGYTMNAGFQFRISSLSWSSSDGTFRNNCLCISYPPWTSKFSKFDYLFHQCKIMKLLNKITRNLVKSLIMIYTGI